MVLELARWTDDWGGAVGYAIDVCVCQMLTWCALVQLGFAGGHHWVSLPGHV